MKFDWVRILPEGIRIFIRPGYTDMRKSIFTLGYLVQTEMNLDLIGNSIFLFCNKRKDTMKILYWDENGYCLWMKKLETDRFPFPESIENVHELSRQRLDWLLHGIDFRKEHTKFNFSRAI